MAYKSRFRPKNLQKYIGNMDNIICRSTWERALAMWADRNKAVIKWGIENVIIRYFDKGKGKLRSYYVDFFMEFSDGRKWLIEVKPKNQTIPPPKPKRMSRKYINAVMTYATNTSKWEEATRYAEEKNMKFYVWTEDHLRQLGLRII